MYPNLPVFQLVPLTSGSVASHQWKEVRLGCLWTLPSALTFIRCSLSVSGVSPTNLLKVQSAPSSRSLMKILNRIQYWPLWPTANHWHPARICLIDNQPLDLDSFQSTSLSAPPSTAPPWRPYRTQCRSPYWSPGRKYPLLFPHLPGQVDLLHLRSLSSWSGMTFSWLATHDDFLILNVLRINWCISFPGTEVTLVGL